MPQKQLLNHVRISKLKKDIGYAPELAHLLMYICAKVAVSYTVQYTLFYPITGCVSFKLAQSAFC